MTFSETYRTERYVHMYVCMYGMVRYICMYGMLHMYVWYVIYV
jgi:hypothetical protein